METVWVLIQMLLQMQHGKNEFNKSTNSHNVQSKKKTQNSKAVDKNESTKTIQKGNRNKQINQTKTYFYFCYFFCVSMNVSTNERKENKYMHRKNRNLCRNRSNHKKATINLH